MSLKYCDDCHEAVEQVVMSCPNCKCTTFVHGAEIMKRDKKERAERPKTADPIQTTAPTTEPTQKTPRSEKSDTETRNAPDWWVAQGSSKTGKTLDDLIRAQNRTTHAVRAFVRFLFIQLTGITLAFFLWNLSLAFVNTSDCIRSGENCSGNVALQFLAVGVWIATVIVSSNAGWDELKKSEIG
jgi:hypothetical protein